MKTCRELEENAAKPSGRRDWRDPLFERRDICGQNRLAVVRELLPGLDRELELSRRARNPALRCFGSAWAIESGIHFDGIEIPRIELQFVAFFEGIEDSGPRAGTAARRIAPAAGSNAPDSRVIAFLQL